MSSTSPNFTRTAPSPPVLLRPRPPLPPRPPRQARQNRPPRIQIYQPSGNGTLGSPMQVPPSTQVPPLSAQTIHGMIGPQGQPYWPDYTNAFAASNFMSKGFEELIDFAKSGMSFGEKFTFGLYHKFHKWSQRWFTHIFLLVVVLLYSVSGAVIFQHIEGKQNMSVSKKTEAVTKDMTKDQLTFLHAIRNLTNDSGLHTMDAGFTLQVLHILRQHENAVISLLNTDPDIESSDPWTFWNAMFYCGTIYTTIGYGHMTPKTTLGRSLTIVYAIIGVPMFLILLADFGKLLTRAIKFVWAYVRRMYYTGTCRKVRKQQQFLDVMSGFNTMYDFAMRAPNEFLHGGPTDEESAQTDPTGKIPTPMTPLFHMTPHPETPLSPYPETFIVDDEFNLPISVANIILITYIFCGSLVYWSWEDWSYFDSFYFVFISMSTIGFGDLVPKHPIFMMCSIIYLVFGLALTSMFINVVQIKLSEMFKDASAKIGATIGLTMTEGSESHGQSPCDRGSVHTPKLDPISENVDEEVREEKTSPLPTSVNKAEPSQLLSKHTTTVEKPMRTKKEKCKQEQL